jgi:hypothetical protein
MKTQRRLQCFVCALVLMYVSTSHRSSVLLVCDIDDAAAAEVCCSCVCLVCVVFANVQYV